MGVVRGVHKPSTIDSFYGTIFTAFVALVLPFDPFRGLRDGSFAARFFGTRERHELENSGGLGILVL